MTQTIPENRFFFEKKDGELIGVTETLVDETLGVGSDEFDAEAELTSYKLVVKQREEALSLPFEGWKIMKSNCEILLR